MAGIEAFLEQLRAAAASQGLQWLQWQIAAIEEEEAAGTSGGQCAWRSRPSRALFMPLVPAHVAAASGAGSDLKQFLTGLRSLVQRFEVSGSSPPPMSRWVPG